MKNIRILFVLAFVSSTAITLNGCAPAIVGMAATGGYFAAQEKGVDVALSDSRIKGSVLEKITNAYYGYAASVGISVLGGNVLLTGVLPAKKDISRVVAETQKVRGVQSIYNELSVGEYGADEVAEDLWISGQIRARMLVAKHVFTINYGVRVVKNHAYIIGTASKPEEKDEVLHIARTTQGVVKVHDYVKVSKPNETPSAPAEHAPTVEAEDISTNE